MPYPWIKYKMSEGPLTVKEVHQGVNEQLNRKLGTDWGYSEYEWADLLQGFRPLPIKTASGSIAHFTDGADAVPLKSLAAQILPKQSGTGTPSPSNPRPISGTSVLNVEQAGANLIDPSTIEVSGTIQVRFFREDNILLKKDVTYKFVYLGTNQATLYFAKPDSGTYVVGTGKVLSFTPSEDCYAWLQALNLQGIETESNKFVLTCDGSVPTTYAPYTATTTTIALNRTIYGGSAEVVGGAGSETHGYIASYNGEAINEPWLSSIDPYVQGTTPSIGAEVVYPLTTPESFTFDGVRVESLEGVNNVWTDSGDVTVEYRSNF